MRIQIFDASVPITDALLWQESTSKSLQALAALKQEWYQENHTKFWQDWYDNVFNLQTANDFGCSVWGIILGIPLTLGPPPDPSGKKNWGFGSLRKNFMHGNFTSSGAAGLTLEEKRIVLKLRYFQLSCRCAIPEINKFLQFLFKDIGTAYILDNLDMSITYVFNFQLSDNLIYMFEKYHLLPRMDGVRLRDHIFDTGFWGFDKYNANFDQAPFVPDDQPGVFFGFDQYNQNFDHAGFLTEDTNVFGFDEFNVNFDNAPFEIGS